MCETIKDMAKEMELKGNKNDFLADKVEISNVEILIEMEKKSS